MTRPTDWTDDQVADLIRLHAAGLPVADIADAVGRSLQSCHTKIKLLRADGVTLARRNALPASRRTAERLEADGDIDALRSARACAAHGRDIERSGRRWGMEVSA